MNLLRKLDRWEKAGLLTEAQKQAITAYEKQSRAPRGMWALLIISALFIGTGIISLIAANWDNIPGAVKIGLDWLVLGGAAGSAAYCFHKGKETAKEFWLVVYALLILGSIGLTAQVFQIQSYDLRGLFIWALLLIPLLPWSCKPILAMVWVPVFVYSGLDLLSNQKWFQELSDWFERSFAGAVWIVLLILGAFLYNGLKQRLQKCKPQIVRAWGFWLAIFLAAAVICFDLLSGWSWFGGYGRALSSNLNGNGTALIMLAAAALIWTEQKLGSGRIFGLIIALLVFFYAGNTAIPETELAHQLWGVLLTLSCLGAVMLFACRSGRRLLLNWATGLAILRIFIIYLQVFGSLLLTGIGLISSGAVMLLLIGGWNHLRHSNIFNKWGGQPCQNAN